MKRWLSPWVLPLLMLGVVIVVTRPVVGAVWIVASVVLVRLLNGRFELPAEDEPLRRYFDDPKHSHFGAQEPRWFRSPSWQHFSCAPTGSCHQVAAVSGECARPSIGSPLTCDR